MSKRDELLNLGFKEFKHKTIGNAIIYLLSRNRYLTMSSIDTPNEILAIGELDDIGIPESVVILKNYDYDGYTSIETIKTLIEILDEQKK